MADKRRKGATIEGSALTALEEEYLARNRVIGEIVAEARMRERRSVTECARLLETSRARYKLVEEGESSLTVVELEKLLAFLRVPVSEIVSVPNGVGASEGSGREFRINMQPGDILHVTAGKAT